MAITIPMVPEASNKGNREKKSTVALTRGLSSGYDCDVSLTLKVGSSIPGRMVSIREYWNIPKYVGKFERKHGLA